MNCGWKLVNNAVTSSFIGISLIEAVNNSLAELLLSLSQFSHYNRLSRAKSIGKIASVLCIIHSGICQAGSRELTLHYASKSLPPVVTSVYLAYYITDIAFPLGIEDSIATLAV